jgi:hypothetical protein
MIPVFIIWLIRRARQRKPEGRGQTPPSVKLLTRATGIFILIIILLLSMTGHAQTRRLSYQILRNGNRVGHLNFFETTRDGADYLKMESDVQTRFIFTFTAHASEEAVYSNGILLRSSIYRTLNGHERVNREHVAHNSEYIIRDGKNTEVGKQFPITYSMLSMYLREPENIGSVYSDNFQTFLNIQKLDRHKYKIALPDGNYNFYSYQAGVLNEIEIHHNLYSATIVLSNN